MPYLVFNPQANSSPCDSRFTDFRKFVLNSSNKEIISLNWNSDSKIGHNNLLPQGSSRTGFFVNSTEVDTNNYSRIKHNHDLGLYYFNMSAHRHVFLCNSSPHAFIISIPPVSIINALPVQIRRDGPVVEHTLCFNNSDILELQGSITDGHIALLASLGCTNIFVGDHGGCIIEKERLACLTAGEIPKKAGASWYLLDNLASVRIDDTTEINRRFTVSEDRSPESVSQRKKYIRAINELNNYILPRKHLYPESIADLRDIEVILGYCQFVQGGRKRILLDNFKYNLTTAYGEKIAAVVCYLEYPEEWEVNEKFDALQGLFEDENNNKGRVVIFYKIGQDILVRSDDTAGKIANTENYNGPSILKV